MSTTEINTGRYQFVPGMFGRVRLEIEVCGTQGLHWRPMHNDDLQHLNMQVAVRDGVPVQNDWRFPEGRPQHDGAI